MFKIQSGRLYPDMKPQCLSFKIPEGFWLDSDPLTLSDNQLTIWTPEKDARVEVRLEEHMAETTEGELYKFFFASDEEFYEDEFEVDAGGSAADSTTDKYGPYPIEHSGFKGHYAFSCGSVSQYSVLLDISALGLKDEEGKWFDRIEILILTHEECSVKEIAERSSVQELMESFIVE
ncbi:MAG: hypothetical protein LIP11_05955 [Clostridiales bacterium]|nr:hypothetical protein [Clostridiales bacterium]